MYYLMLGSILWKNEKMKSVLSEEQSGLISSYSSGLGSNEITTLASYRSANGHFSLVPAYVTISFL